MGSCPGSSVLRESQSTSSSSVRRTIEITKSQMIKLYQKARSEGRSISYASGNFGKALVFSSADLTILYLLTDVLDVPGAQAANLMLIAILGDLLFDMLA
ncbi:MAG: hypothetical protein WBL20_15180, partial [Sphingobium sp.]